MGIVTSAIALTLSQNVVSAQTVTRYGRTYTIAEQDQIAKSNHEWRWLRDEPTPFDGVDVVTAGWIETHDCEHIDYYHQMLPPSFMTTEAIYRGSPLRLYLPNTRFDGAFSQACHQAAHRLHDQYEPWVLVLVYGTVRNGTGVRVSECIDFHTPPRPYDVRKCNHVVVHRIELKQMLSLEEGRRRVLSVGLQQLLRVGGTALIRQLLRQNEGND